MPRPMIARNSLAIATDPVSAPMPNGRRRVPILRSRLAGCRQTELFRALGCKLPIGLRLLFEGFLQLRVRLVGSEAFEVQSVLEVFGQELHGCATKTSVSTSRTYAAEMAKNV